MESQACMLVQIAPHEIEEPLVDWLLTRDEVTGFTEQTVYGHSRENADISVTEQVMGRQKKIMFRILALTDVAQGLVIELKKDFKSVGLHYWMNPVLDNSVIS